MELGVAANIIAAVNLSAKIALLCGRYSLAVKDAKNDIERLQKEVNSVTHALQEVERLLQSPNSERLSAFQKLGDAVEDCLSQLTELNKKLEVGTTRKAMG